MNKWKGGTMPHEPWRLVLLVIVFMILEAILLCVVGTAMLKKENPMCCPEDERVESWHEIWGYE